MKKVLTIAALFSLIGCTNSQSPEENQCAQENYMCERNCEQTSPENSLSHQVCSGECIDRYNECKAQVESLKKRTFTSPLYPK